jgi:hypothetical protein
VQVSVVLVGGEGHRPGFCRSRSATKSKKVEGH